MSKPEEKYKIHPLCEFLPEMNPAEFKDLVADIKANGQREPIWLFQGKIIDGRNRYLACREAGIEPLIEDVKLSEKDILPYIISKNIMRRHLSTGQRATLAVELAGEQARLRAKVNPKAEKATAVSSLTRKARQMVAKSANVSTGSVATAAKLKRQDPKAFEEVKAGKKTLHAATATAQRLAKDSKPKPPCNATVRREVPLDVNGGEAPLEAQASVVKLVGQHLLDHPEDCPECGAGVEVNPMDAAARLFRLLLNVADSLNWHLSNRCPKGLNEVELGDFVSKAATRSLEGLKEENVRGAKEMMGVFLLQLYVAFAPEAAPGDSTDGTPRPIEVELVSGGPLTDQEKAR